LQNLAPMQHRQFFFLAKLFSDFFSSIDLETLAKYQDSTRSFNR
jgi:hypothetical protein